ncbi:uncharacterized protein LOC135207099 [Macrobrachium nipponense]|uniref:uncharacterized protein LOC135207099 n=1 Tax=Macrobrachium nipponense TaxID=159736 RepID=UPI0030C8BF20
MFPATCQNGPVVYPCESEYSQENYLEKQIDLVNSPIPNFNHSQFKAATLINKVTSANTRNVDLLQSCLPNQNYLPVWDERFASSGNTHSGGFETSFSFSGTSDQQTYDDRWSESSPHQGETVDDITTWSLDTIKEVASAVEATVSDNQTTTTCGSDVGTGYEEVRRRMSGGQIPRTRSQRQTAYEDAGPSGISCGFEKKRKTKLYQLGPQDDMKLEIKRLRALQAHAYRERKEHNERQALIKIRTMEREICSLKKEREDRRFTVSVLEAQLSRLQLASEQQERDGTPRDAFSDGCFAQSYDE